MLVTRSSFQFDTWVPMKTPAMTMMRSMAIAVHSWLRT